MANLPQGFVLESSLPPGFVLEGDLPQSGADPDVPTAQNLAQQPQQRETSLGEDIVGGLETGAAFISGIVAEPIAGIAGLASGAFGDLNSAVNTIAAVKDSLTYEPRSEASKQQLQAIGQAIKPVADTFRKVETTLGESVLEATGSPELATIAHTLPTAALEVLGVKGLRSAKSPIAGQKLSSNVSKAITQAAPDFDTIKQAKTTAYNELDNFGVRVNERTYDRFADTIASRLKSEGVDPTLTPKANAALKRIVDEKGSPKSLQELDTIRKIARGAANDIDKTEQRLGSIIIDELDKGVEKLSNEIGGKFKEARDLAQRGFKSQAITDMIENASHTASGLENGLRIEARKILKNKKKRRGFNRDEIEALKQIEQGTTASNTAKFLGKFGISEGQATSMLGASIGVGGGGSLGAVFGGPLGAGVGALTVPTVGQVAKNTAQRLTLRNTKFADDLARSGKNAKSITRAYLKHTPVKDRSVSDLTDLLLQTGVNPSDIRSLPKSMTRTNKLVADAKFFAEEILRRAQQVGSAAIATTPLEQEQ